jgi:hypothetical protein
MSISKNLLSIVFIILSLFAFLFGLAKQSDDDTKNLNYPVLNNLDYNKQFLDFNIPNESETYELLSQNDTEIRKKFTEANKQHIDFNTKITEEIIPNLIHQNLEMFKKRQSGFKFQTQF